MKRTFTLITGLIFSVTLLAAVKQTGTREVSNQSRLTISSVAKYPVKVVIDDRNYNQGMPVENEIVIRSIKPGYHNIKIYQQKSNGNTKRRIYNTNLQLVYNGNIYVKPRYHVDVLINRFGKALIDERAINPLDDEYGDENDHQWNNNDHFPQSMNGAMFEQLKQTVKNGTYDDTKITIAKQTIDANYFTSAQVKEMLGLFNYENSKLEIAKYAYKKSIDKNNYFIVSNALTYSSSKEELARYLQNR